MKSNNTARKSAASKGGASAKGSRGQSSRKSAASANGRSNGATRAGSRKSSTRTPQESLEKMFEDLLKDTYWAEKHLLKSMPRIGKNVESQELRDAFDNHLRETEEQVGRLDQVFELCGLRPSAKKCEAMEGLVEEGKELVQEHERGPVLDAALIIAAQKIEHYEIAAYGSLRTLAQVMGRDEAADLLQQTLEEESNTDELLTQIAMRINQEAYGAGEESEGSEEEEDYDEDETDDVEMSDDDEEENAEGEEEEEEEGASQRGR